MKRIKWNSPVILGFVVICGIVLALDYVTAGSTTTKFFSVYKGS